MRFVIVVGVIVVAWVGLYLTRDSWGDWLSDVIANKVHNAIHDSTPSGPSFLKDFAKNTGRKIINLEIKSI